MDINNYSGTSAVGDRGAALPQASGSFKAPDSPQMLPMDHIGKIPRVVPYSHLSNLPVEIVTHISEGLTDDPPAQSSLRGTSRFFQGVVESLPDSGRNLHLVNKINKFKRQMLSLGELQEEDCASVIEGIVQGGLKYLNKVEQDRLVGWALQLGESH